MDEDDLLADLENLDELANVKNTLDKENTTNKPSYNSNWNMQNKKWPWEENDFKPKKIDPETFKKVGKSYTVAYSSAADIDDDITNKFTKIAKALLLKGYILRHRGGETDKLWNELISLEGMKYESYLPWKKFNTNIKTPLTFSTTKEVHELVANYHIAYNKLKPGLKNILATEIYTCLSDTLNNPCDLIIVYSPKGDETITKNVDFKVLGNTSFILRIGEACGIPIINIAKENALTRLLELVKNKEALTTTATE